MKTLGIVALLGLAPLAAPTRADAPAEKDPIEGTWRPVSAEFAGNPYPDQVLKTMKLVLGSGKYAVRVGEQLDEGTVSLDPNSSPKGMDVHGTEGPNKGKTFLAIYERRGDELRVCYDLSGKSRPTGFASEKGTQQFLVTYRKVEP